MYYTKCTFITSHMRARNKRTAEKYEIYFYVWSASSGLAKCILIHDFTSRSLHKQQQHPLHTCTRPHHNTESETQSVRHVHTVQLYYTVQCTCFNSIITCLNIMGNSDDQFESQSPNDNCAVILPLINKFLFVFPLLIDRPGRSSVVA